MTLVVVRCDQCGQPVITDDEAGHFGTYYECAECESLDYDPDFDGDYNYCDYCDGECTGDC